MRPHPHADLLNAIADGYPIEYQDRDGTWHLAEPSHVLTLLGSPNGAPLTPLRVAERVITLGGHTVPRPLQTPPAVGSFYNFANLAAPSGANSYVWRGDKTDYHLLHAGLIYVTERAASKASQALLSVLEKELIGK